MYFQLSGKNHGRFVIILRKVSYWAYWCWRDLICIKIELICGSCFERWLRWFLKHYRSLVNQGWEGGHQKLSLLYLAFQYHYPLAKALHYKKSICTFTDNLELKKIWISLYNQYLFYNITSSPKIVDYTRLESKIFEFIHWRIAMCNI